MVPPRRTVRASPGSLAAAALTGPVERARALHWSRSSECRGMTPVWNSTFSLGIYLTIYLSIYLNYLAVRVRKQYNFLMGRLSIIVAVFITE